MTTLLRYGLTTEPFPLQTSPAAGPAFEAGLTVVASNPNKDPDRHPVTLQGLSIIIPVGPDADDLTATAAGIVPVAPSGWTPQDAKPAAGLMEYPFAPQPGQGVVGETGLAFVLENIATNTKPGPSQITVKEGSAGNPIEQFSVSKFPPGWGEVSFSANPLQVAYKAGSTLSWSGPAGATYSIEYVLDEEVVTVPAQNEPALGSQGQYPAETDSPLALDQTTIFTLKVSETIDGENYETQQQQVVTVAIPAPRIIFLRASPMGLSGDETAVTVSWQTDNVSELHIDGIHNAVGAEVAQGSIQVTLRAPQLLLAEGSGITGYTGAPATTQACFGQAVLSTPFPWASIPCPKNTSATTKIWTLVLSNNRAVFDLNIDAGDYNADDWLMYRIWLALLPGVQVADLGTSGPAATSHDLSNATYTPSLPETDIWTCGTYQRPDGWTNRGEEAQEQYPLAYGATWGVRFPDNTEALVWFEGVGYAGQTVSWVNFFWFEF